MIFQPTLPFGPWKDTHGKHLCHALRKPHMSPLIGQFASVSERLSVWTPIPLHTVEISFGEMTLQRVRVPRSLSKGQRLFQTQRSGTRSYLGESFDLFLLSACARTNCITGRLIETWQHTAPVKGSPSPDLGSQASGHLACLGGKAFQHFLPVLPPQHPHWLIHRLHCHQFQKEPLVSH